jgi:peptide/nickel transport system substrate-binding protein
MERNRIGGVSFWPAVMGQGTAGPGAPGVGRRRLLRAAGALGLAAGAAPLGLSGARAATPTRGGTLTMARVADVISFEPVVPTDNMSIWAKLLVFQMLIRSNQKGDGFVPDLAETWEASADKRTYTFHLRQNALFSDGTPVTSADVKFSFTRVLTDKDSWAASLYPTMDIATPDPHTVVFNLKEDWAPFLAAVSTHAACITPEAYFKKMGASAFGEKPIGSGPFIMQEWHKGDHILMVRNPRFWDPTRPYLDQVIFSVVADDNVRMLKLQSGEIDIGSDVPFSQIARLSHAPGMSVQLATYDRIDWFQFNVKSPKFADPKVRQAFNYAVDKQAIIQAALFGYGSVPTTFLPKMMDADTQDPPYAFDLAKAQALMAASSMPDGFSVTCTTVSGDTVGNQVAQIIQQMLLPLKVKISITPLEGNTQYNQLATGKYEMAWGYMTSDIIDPCELIAYAGAGDEGSDAVWTFYNNTKVNALAKQGLSELDPTKRAATYLEMQRIIWQDAPFLWLYWTPARTGVRANVHDFQVLTTGNYWIEDVWKS